jgi:hypothetical protein
MSTSGRRRYRDWYKCRDQIWKVQLFLMLDRQGLGKPGEKKIRQKNDNLGMFPNRQTGKLCQFPGNDGVCEGIAANLDIKLVPRKALGAGNWKMCITSYFSRRWGVRPSVGFVQQIVMV